MQTVSVLKDLTMNSMKIGHDLEVSPSVLEIILGGAALPDLLHFSQTCKDARFLKPQIFDLGLKLRFKEQTGLLWVCDANPIFWANRQIWEKYCHYFPYGKWAHGSNYYYGTIEESDIFDLIEAAKNDDAEYIESSNILESEEDSEGMEYFFHIGFSPELEAEWRKNDFWPECNWDILWWYGGPKVKYYIEQAH